MKRIILLSALITTISASGYAQMGLGIEVGFNMSDYTVTKNDVVKATDPKLGGRLGIIGDIALSDNFYFQPGLHYVTNGYKTDLPNGSDHYIVNTVEVPLNIQYKIGVLGANRLFVGLGPYFGWNKDGYHRTFSGSYIDSREDLRIGNGARDQIRMFDFGGGVNVGYQITAGLFVRLRAQMGFINQHPMGNTANSITSTGFSVSGGYIFYKKNRHGQVQINRDRDKNQQKKAEKMKARRK